MAGVRHKLRELSHHVRRTAAALDKATSRLCSRCKSYAHHHVTKRAARWWHALRCGAGQVCPPQLGSLFVHAAYILLVSWLGYLLLDELKFRAPPAGDGGGTGWPRGIDLFFTAVSAMTVSSMSAVEMEVFSDGQLFVLTVLMFTGGEVFVSLVGLASKWSKLRKQGTISISQRVESHDDEGVELETTPQVANATDIDSWTRNSDETSKSPIDAKLLRREAVRSLSLVVLAIVVAAHVLGAAAIAAYVYASPGARRTLRSKALGVWTFVVFTTVSMFSNCGFMPNNENMAAFRRDTGLQLLLVPLALSGNTLFPTLLAVCVRAAAAATRRPELVEMTGRNGRELTGYYHLLPARRCAMLAATVAGLVAMQVCMVCGMEWGGALWGMGPWEKVSNAVFVAMNSRHTGESTLDLSTLSPAILVLFVLIMYLPPYTTWFPFEESSGVKDHPTEETQGVWLLKSTLLSQLSYLAIFVIAICITERENLEEDPLNFSVLSIVVEVVSAYGNVGFSMGYSCGRQISPDRLCTDRWTGFAGRWSDSGKLILILVMLFGRLKKFGMKGGKAWKLS